MAYKTWMCLFCALHFTMTVGANSGDSAMVPGDEDDMGPRSATDLARAWESVASLRRRAHALQLAS